MWLLHMFVGPKEKGVVKVGKVCKVLDVRGCLGDPPLSRWESVGAVYCVLLKIPPFTLLHC